MSLTSATGTSTPRTAPDHVPAAASRKTRRGRVIAVTGAVYVASWVTGLLLAPATPAATAPAGTIHEYYATEGASILVQSSLIHGIAGVSLAVLAFAIPAAAAASVGLSRVIKATGVAAALVSLCQVAIAAVAVSSAGSATAATSERLFDTLNIADTVKLVLLAIFAASTTLAAARSRLVGRRTRALTAALVVALPIGGAAFLIDNPLLTAVLYASLPLLLTWAAAISWQVGRRAR